MDKYWLTTITGLLISLAGWSAYNSKCGYDLARDYYEHKGAIVQKLSNIEAALQRIEHRLDK